MRRQVNAFISVGLSILLTSFSLEKVLTYSLALVIMICGVLLYAMPIYLWLETLSKPWGFKRLIVSIALGSTYIGLGCLYLTFLSHSAGHNFDPNYPGVIWMWLVVTGIIFSGIAKEWFPEQK
jgi:hypothetical protein